MEVRIKCSECGTTGEQINRVMRCPKCNTVWGLEEDIRDIRGKPHHCQCSELRSREACPFCGQPCHCGGNVVVTMRKVFFAR